jgi:kynurenine formamidase
LGGAQRLGIDKVGGFAARAVLLDMVRYFGVDQWLPAGQVITGADLEGAASTAGVEVRAGDVVLIRTGYLQWWFDNHANGGPEGFEQAGIGNDAARWLAARDVVAVGADNSAVECIPFDEGDFLTVHKILLVRAGIYMLEHMNLAAPAADGVVEGLLAVGPLLVTGATGSPINPILIA